jgi:tetratricopeptide (TPR) repeat protein
VLGLALAAEGKADEARKEMAEARKLLPPSETAYLEQMDVAQRALDNPVEYYRGETERLLRWQGPTALAALEAAVKAAPEADRAALSAELALLRLDVALFQVKGGRLADKDLAEAKKAAEDAKALPHGQYALGRIAEALGDPETAAAHYQKAVEATPEGPLAGVYRAALSRALSLPKLKLLPQPPKEDKVGGLGRADAAEGAELAQGPTEEAVATLLLATLFYYQDEQADRVRAEKLAREILDNPNAPLEAKAEAYLQLRMYTDALRTYAESLRSKVSPEAYQGLQRMIDSHPALRGGGDLRVINPVEADRLYGVGLRLYFVGDYAGAEREFAGAIKEDDGDARYWYYRGLARLAQGKQAPAQSDFVEGAKLEKINRPSPAAVNYALERVQGPVRSVINAERAKPH